MQQSHYMLLSMWPQQATVAVLIVFQTCQSCSTPTTPMWRHFGRYSHQPLSEQGTSPWSRYPQAWDMVTSAVYARCLMSALATWQGSTLFPTSTTSSCSAKCGSGLRHGRHGNRRCCCVDSQTGQLCLNGMIRFLSSMLIVNVLSLKKLFSFFTIYFGCISQSSSVDWISWSCHMTYIMWHKQEPDWQEFLSNVSV